jgi:alkylated DNA nucleotide flippase Atl1
MTGPDRVARQVGAALRRARERRRCPQHHLADPAGITRARLARVAAWLEEMAEEQSKRLEGAAADAARRGGSV